MPAAEVERLQLAMMATPPNPGVRMAPPHTDAEALQAAKALAERVQAELAGLEAESTLDEFMAGHRGRTWSP